MVHSHIQIESSWQQLCFVETLFLYCSPVKCFLLHFIFTFEVVLFSVLVIYITYRKMLNMYHI